MRKVTNGWQKPECFGLARGELALDREDFGVGYVEAMKLIGLLIPLVGLVLIAFAAFAGEGQTVKKFDEEGGIAGPTPGSPKRKDKVIKTDAEWQKILTPEQFRILRKQGTEPPFCGLFHDSDKQGTYYCAGCELELFTSSAKFHSGTGWPSFFQPANEKNIWIRIDRSYGMVREEVLCARCDGHLGHVFDDGPKPTGLRFCINSDALKFRPKR